MAKLRQDRSQASALCVGVSVLGSYGGVGIEGLVMLKQRRGSVRNSLTWLGWACVALFITLMALIGIAAVRGYY